MQTSNRKKKAFLHDSICDLCELFLDLAPITSDRGFFSMGRNRWCVPFRSSVYMVWRKVLLSCALIVPARREVDPQMSRCSSRLVLRLRPGLYITASRLGAVDRSGVGNQAFSDALSGPCMGIRDTFYLKTKPSMWIFHNAEVSARKLKNFAQSLAKSDTSLQK